MRSRCCVRDGIVVALDPPWEVVTLLNFIGIKWPMINEDSVREVASAIEQFSSDMQNTHQDMTSQIQAMGNAYQGASYEKLVTQWESRSTTHLTELTDVLKAITRALQGLADYIVVQKGEAIGQLIGAAGSFVAAQLAAPETFGLSELADAGVDELANKAISLLKELVTQYIEGQVISAAFGQIGPAVERALEGWAFKFIDGGVPGGGGEVGDKIMVDTATLRSHADAMNGHAETMRQHAVKLNAKLSAIDFT